MSGAMKDSGGGADQVTVEHSAARERYSAIVGDELVGYLDYVAEPERMVLTHTVVHDRYAGRGYAGQLVRYVLDDIRASGKRVVPVCSYVVAYIERNPEYQDLVDAT